MAIDPEHIFLQMNKKKSTSLSNKSNDELGSFLKLKVVDETPDYLVVNKPTGVLVHPTSADEPNTLTKQLLQKYPELKNVGEDKMRPGIVHRLDKDASGLMVVARTQPMFELLKKQFQERQVEKEYLVLVHGKVVADTNEINFPLKRSKNGRMASIPKTKRGEPTDIGRQSKTEFWVEKRFINFTLLRVKIFTGRTHQIRAHMLAYGHPVVGDLLYYQKKQSRKWDDKLGRLFLHCVKLGFNDPNGQKQNFELNLQKELKDFLKEIK
ncbi:MAG: RNA pseudouridine synthase [bacterium]